MRQLLRVFPLLVVAANIAGALPPELNDLSVRNALGGADVLETLRHAKAVTAQRVDEPSPEPRPGDPRPDLIELSPPRPLSPEAADRLTQILGSASTYLAPPKQCQFRANVRCRWDDVAIVFCFGCGELEVWKAGRMRSFASFDSAYGPLLEIFQAAFPEDSFLKEFSPEIFEKRVQAMREAAAQETPVAD